MKIALPTREGRIDNHFGRCSWFCVYDTGTGEVGFVENTFTSSNDSAGVQVVEVGLS